MVVVPPEYGGVAMAASCALIRRGIDIATITEAHGGPYAGHHARYVLKSKVERLSDLQVAA